MTEIAKRHIAESRADLIWSALCSLKWSKMKFGVFVVLRAILRRIGFDVYHPAANWFSDKDFLNLVQQWNPKINFIKDTHYQLYSLAKATCAVPGHTAECGVLDGAGSWIVCKAVEDKEKKHFLFDSFQGLSAPKEKDHAQDAIFEWKEGDLSMSEALVRENLKDIDRPLEFGSGWIPEKFPIAENCTFSFVHIDVDLYQPTLDALHFFYGRMSKGGVILCDDYNSNSCPGAKLAFDEFFKDKPENVIETCTCQAYVFRL